MNALYDLAARARTGDASAAAALREQLAGPLRHIVRRALRTDADESSVVRRIRAEADRVSSVPPWDSAEREVLVSRVAGRLCDSVARNVRPEAGESQRAYETMRL